MAKKKKTTSVGRTAAVAKPPAPSRQKPQPGAGSSHHHAAHKHQGTHKHHATAKHHRKTGLALAPGDVACCAAQALAASLRLSLGVTVHDEDVLALYWRTAGDPDEGASVLATLEAASGSGLAEFRPVFTERPPDHSLLPFGQRARHRIEPDLGKVDHGIGVGVVHGLILGLDLPEGPHAVTAAPDGTWWSWGEPHSPADFPGAVIDECWAVHWS